jgi:hypothetical protein
MLARIFMFSRYVTLFVLSLAPLSSLHADMIGFPDDLISNKGEAKLELGLSYGNGTSFSCSSALAGCYRVNYDLLSWAPGIRYGINPTTEIYTRLGYSSMRSSYNDVSLSAGGQFVTQDVDFDRFTDVWFGINHRIWNDATTPGLLLFLEGAAVENTSFGSHIDSVYGKTWIGGATLYRSIDPVILSATVSYRYSASRNTYDSYTADLDVLHNSTPTSTNPADSILFNPSISFAANNEVSITSGFQWQRQIDGDRSASRTDLTLGMGYMWSDALTLHVSTSTDMTGDGGSSISMLLLYTLGKDSKNSTTSKASDISVASEDSDKDDSDTNTSSQVQPQKSDTTSIKTTQETKDIKDELSDGTSWVQSQKSNHYTLEIFNLSLKNNSKTLSELSKIRESIDTPSYLFGQKNKKASILIGSFTSSEDAISYLNKLPLVTHKKNSRLRTFGGLQKSNSSQQ